MIKQITMERSVAVKYNCNLNKREEKFDYLLYHYYLFNIKIRIITIVGSRRVVEYEFTWLDLPNPWYIESIGRSDNIDHKNNINENNNNILYYNPIQDKW